MPTAPLHPHSPVGRTGLEPPRPLALRPSPGQASRRPRLSVSPRHGGSPRPSGSHAGPGKEPAGLREGRRQTGSSPIPQSPRRGCRDPGPGRRRLHQSRGRETRRPLSVTEQRGKERTRRNRGTAAPPPTRGPDTRLRTAGAPPASHSPGRLRLRLGRRRRRRDRRRRDRNRSPAPAPPRPRPRARPHARLGAEAALLCPALCSSGGILSNRTSFALSKYCGNSGRREGGRKQTPIPPKPHLRLSLDPAPDGGEPGSGHH